MEFLVLLVVVGIGVILAGGVCGIIAVARQGRLVRESSELRHRLERLEARIGEMAKEGERPAPAPDAAAASPPVPEPTPRTVEPPRPFIPVPPPPVTSEAFRAAPPPPMGSEAFRTVPPPPPRPPVFVPGPPSPPRREGPSLEVLLGTKWLGWAGALLVLFGAAFFLKWAYDREIIPPEARLAIGTLAGVAALGLGEYFRRRAWQPLFQALTGIGIATFYLCIFFSFHIYNLSGQGLAFGLAALVTGLAVVMAVAHNALPIAILGVIGGFLSPVVFSGGGNHPYALFSYVLIVDLVALGAAYFRRWRALDLLCFVGTALLYQGWFSKYYKPDTEMLPALLFTTVFYALFLIIPTLYSLTRRIPEGIDGLALVVLNSLFAFVAYYAVLYHEYRYVLGFVVVAQAALVFGLFQVWQMRINRDSRTAKSLLIIALALVTIAIPIQLKLYGVPLAWAAEGVLFIWLGMRYREPLVRLGGTVALVLAAGGLINRLPLHRIAFTPVFNIPFGSWVAVISAAMLAAYLVQRWRRTEPEAGDALNISPWSLFDSFLSPGVFLLGFAMGCLLLSMELSLFWSLTARVEMWWSYNADSLMVLWTLIPVAVLAVAYRRKDVKLVYLSAACYAIGVFAFLGALSSYESPLAILALNTSFLSRVLFIGAVFWGAWIVRRMGLMEEVAVGVEAAGNVMLAILLAFEFDRWTHLTQVIGPRMGTALISAAWAVQAFALICVGLLMRKQPLRWLGMLLFGLTVLKVLIFDTAQLEQIYRIVSLMATGILLLAAVWAYHRFGSMLLEEDKGERT